MKLIVVIALVSFMSLSGPSIVSAETILRTGDTVSVSEGQGIVGDFYSLASIVNISGRVEGDVLVAAGQATINGSVTEDVLVLAGNADIHGEVGDDVRVLGNEVVIAEPIAGNLFVAARRVSILSTASIGGDVLVYGSEVEILGDVAGDVLGGYGSLRIDGEVAGVVDVRVDTLALGDGANIAGSLSYVSDSLLERAPNAVVVGQILRNDSVGTDGSNGGELRQYLIVALILAFASLAWFLVSPKTLRPVVQHAISYSPKPILFGIGGLFIFPIIIFILFSSLLGSLTGLVLLGMYISVVLLAIIASPAVVGVLLLKVFGFGETLTVAGVGIGLVITILLWQLSYVGFVIFLAACLVTLGGLIQSVNDVYNS